VFGEAGSTVVIEDFRGRRVVGAGGDQRGMRPCLRVGSEAFARGGPGSEHQGNGRLARFPLQPPPCSPGGTRSLLPTLAELEDRRPVPGGVVAGLMISPSGVPTSSNRLPPGRSRDRGRPALVRPHRSLLAGGRRRALPGITVSSAAAVTTGSRRRDTRRAGRAVITLPGGGAEGVGRSRGLDLPRGNRRDSDRLLRVRGPGFTADRRARALRRRAACQPGARGFDWVEGKQFRRDIGWRKTHGLVTRDS
jgi:hypothetical protein